MKLRVRSFALLLPLALASALTAADVGVGKSFQGPVGLQLYSLRNEFKADGVAKTLDTVKSYGIRYAELAGTYDLKPAQFKAELEARGIKAVAGHFPYKKFKDDPEAIALEAKALGLEYAGCAWADHKAPLDEKQAREIAAVFNKAGAVLAKHGLKFYYHNHGFEFYPYRDGTLMDLIIQETDPKLVCFQMDILWTVFPSQDPAKLLLKYPDRWKLIHLKDLKKGVATGALTGKTDVSNDVALGTGQMKWASILSAAKKVGVKYYFIEDESPSSTKQIPQSLKFLEQVKF
ncbi:MAG: sugar phosphate isomerase/epimerase [Verrucomicrobia bacterium]|nr:sugar phosphate isomerase/epimerase [Verrucomicrobiota bacterium]